MNDLQKQMEEKLYSRNFKKYGMDMNPAVAIGSGLIILIFSLYVLFNVEKAGIKFAEIRDLIITNFDWMFILSSNFFIAVCLYLAFSKLGMVKIGGVDAKPEFSNFSWYSMLLSAGMGIGLMFWSVGEPLYHAEYTPPIYTNIDSAQQALSTTFFHWGFHAWGIYAIIALALAYFAYNKKLPLSIRSVFYPVLKDKIFGFWGDLIDILAVVACLFGLATSLGLGVQQINSGLNYLFGVKISLTMQVTLIAIITGIATISVVSGIDKGVKFLSELNIKVAGVFLLIVFLLGPTSLILKYFINSFGFYINDFIQASFYVSPQDTSWQGGWTVFYLSWWISWSPFVGMFIARISKGRTIKEFVLAVLIIPSILSFIWLSVFGGTAIYVNTLNEGALLETVGNNLPIALFELIQQLNMPLNLDMISGFIKVGLSLIGTFLVISFFVTSSDSGSLVVDNITSGGKLDSPIPQRVFWACMEGFVAAIILIVGGEKALSALQATVISTGLPFAIILIFMCYILLKSVRNTYRVQKRIKEINHFENLIDVFEVQSDIDDNISIDVKQQTLKTISEKKKLKRQKKKKK